MTSGTSSDTSQTRTSHDPLCPYRPQKAIDHGAWDAGQPCYCVLITRVREDERERTL